MDEETIRKLYSDCSLCPRRCHADRYDRPGFCMAGPRIKAARAAIHMWEEPVLAGSGGSGAVFFSGCTLRCVFCQNHEISSEGYGKEISAKALADIFLRLQEEGAENIDLVTASQFVPEVLYALDMVKDRLIIPVIYNSGGYESIETLKLLEGYIDIYLPDVKYCSDELAVRLSKAPGYFDTAIAAVREMIRQTGKPEFFLGSGKLKKGTIIRHMVLPGKRRDSIRILNELEKLGTDNFLISVMSQYTPFYKAKTDKALKDMNRRIFSFEYDEVVDEALRLGMNGFMQEKSSAKEEYTPAFDLKGIADQGV